MQRLMTVKQSYCCSLWCYEATHYPSTLSTSLDVRMSTGEAGVASTESRRDSTDLSIKRGETSRRRVAGAAANHAGRRLRCQRALLCRVLLVSRARCKARSLPRSSSFLRPPSIGAVQLSGRNSCQPASLPALAKLSLSVRSPRPGIPAEAMSPPRRQGERNAGRERRHFTRHFGRHRPITSRKNLVKGGEPHGGGVPSLSVK